MDLTNPKQREMMKTATLDLPPMRMSEIVLKTSRYEEMKAWYQGVLGVAPFYEHTPAAAADDKGGSQVGAPNIRLCFIRMYMEHPYVEVLALFEIPGTRDVPTGDPGLHHMQFRNPSMDDLFTRYERLKAMGILPIRTANHGPGTSFYYHDPDQNVVEISAANYPTLEEYRTFFESDAYKRNPAGIDIDADAYIARYRAGTTLADLVSIPADGASPMLKN